MSAVDVLGVDAVQLPHSMGQISIGRLHQNMIMVPHLAVGMIDPIEPVGYLTHEFQKFNAIGLSEIDILLFVSPSGYMIQGPGIFDSQRSGHTFRLISFLVWRKLP